MTRRYWIKSVHVVYSRDVRTGRIAEVFRSVRAAALAAGVSVMRMSRMIDSGEEYMGFRFVSLGEGLSLIRFDNGDLKLARMVEVPDGLDLGKLL